MKKSDTPESWNHEASDFINKCLARKPTSRLGLNGPGEVKAHVWFKDFEWHNLLARKIKAPLIPNFKKNNFDRKKIFQEIKKEQESNI